ncbi:MAG TPA: choice-of-anchor L domain-containing protein [Polyangiaceae bacterium]|nr:choice-of-anchor L domain-containing protein [Polyangiaceae bacterium]
MACNGDQNTAPPPPSSDDVAMPPTWTCTDADEDGYGVGCRLGSDCDDNDPNVTVECLCDGQKSPGCSCDEAGAQAGCGTVYSRVGDTVVCGQGVTSCDGEEWGECIINNAVTLNASNDKSNLRTLALGTASACATNPCDPACRSFTDTPDNTVPLTNSTGVVATTSGVTLQSGEAISVPGVTSNGYACANSAYPVGGGCAHHVCKTGSALAKYCDGDAQVLTGYTIFSEPFADNSKGWALGTNWAIGSATASTGHGTGNADPSTDTTAGNNNGIAGTVIGGNLGGTSTTLLTDTFASLGSWTQTGDGRWSTANRTGSTGYVSISGNPVAHADRCNVLTCLLTSNVINLSAYTSATLSFQYFLSSNLEAGEYLRLDGSTNGILYNQLMLKNTDADQDSTWRTATISLNSYLTNSTRLRFVTSESSTDEAVEIDDLKIIVPTASVTSYLTSPVINTSGSAGSVTVSFRRWLNTNPEFVAKLEVYNGSTWTPLYTSTGTSVSDSSWQTMSYDVTSYKSANMQLRFSYTGASMTAVSGWNVDDLTVTGQEYTGGSSLCVNKVCAQRPECCTNSWSIECVNLLASACKVECAEDTKNNNACIACFTDPTLTIDVDGDGQSPATGDCRECDSGISAGAYDLPGNNIDENCDGIADNEPTTCDTGSLAANGDASAHAKSLGLCRVASGNSWGVVSTSFVRADGVTACTDSKQYRIMTTFGAGNKPTAGSSMSAFSSGTARQSSDSDYVMPNGDGYDAKTYSAPKYTVPAAIGCSAGTPGYDSCGLKVVLKAPTNANSFGYNFNFFTSEYPEWLCTKYNDAYVAYYEGSLNTATNKNISFDSLSNPVSVNNGLFTIPGWPPPALGLNTLLNGTGFDGVCSNNIDGAKYLLKSICGGSTGWLQTTAPVKPGEQITMIFNVWDTGDHQWDSTVLLDNFTWSTKSASVGTSQYVPSTPPVVQPALYSEGWFVRDYDMSTGCGADLVPVWSLWSWNATTPGDSKVEFYVQTATTAAGLATATRDTLLFTNPPGPTTLAGTAAIAKAGTPDTRTGSATVQNTLVANSRNLHSPFLRISAKLVPTTTKLQAPVLTSWNLQTSCQAAQ